MCNSSIGEVFCFYNQEKMCRTFARHCSNLNPIRKTAVPIQIHFLSFQNTSPTNNTPLPQNYGTIQSLMSVHHFIVFSIMEPGKLKGSVTSDRSHRLHYNYHANLIRDQLPTSQVLIWIYMGLGQVRNRGSNYRYVTLRVFCKKVVGILWGVTQGGVLSTDSFCVEPLT